MPQFRFRSIGSNRHGRSITKPGQKRMNSQHTGLPRRAIQTAPTVNAASCAQGPRGPAAFAHFLEQLSFLGHLVPLVLYVYAEVRTQAHKGLAALFQRTICRRGAMQRLHIGAGSNGRRATCLAQIDLSYWQPLWVGIKGRPCPDVPRNAARDVRSAVVSHLGPRHLDLCSETTSPCAPHPSYPITQNTLWPD